LSHADKNNPADCGLPLAQLLLQTASMSTMKKQFENTFGVMQLLEQILDGFQDGCCRPATQIALYEKYVQLRQSHNAKLIRHLIVIDGTGPSNLMRAKHRCRENPRELPPDR
jgi:hypothetical protein